MKSDAFEIRNLSFDLDGVPRYWHGGLRSVTLFMNNLSLFFPPGERFFIQSVKAHTSLVQDPSLRRDIKLFTGQEPPIDLMTEVVRRALSPVNYAKAEEAEAAEEQEEK